MGMLLLFKCGQLQKVACYLLLTNVCNKYLSITGLLAVLASCNNPTQSPVIPVTQMEAPAVKAKPVIVTYHLKSTKALQLDSSDSSLNFILALNRVDIQHVTRMDSVVVPDSLYTDWMVYSPFPLSLPFLSGVNKLIYFAYTNQAFAVYQNGTLIKWGPVSMGKKSTPTPTGLFHTNWRSKKTTSTVNSDWVMEWYFNLENRLGVSMHQFDMPGYPASHACIRMYREDAMWFYNWCDPWITNNDRIRSIKAYGTPVIIFGTYPFGQTKPWLKLAENKDALNYSAEQLQQQTSAYLPVILARQATRDSVIKQEPVRAVAKEQQHSTISKP